MGKEMLNSSRKADCVTETRMGNTTLVAYGFLNLDATETAVDKMLKVLRTEIENTNTSVSIA